MFWAIELVRDKKSKLPTNTIEEKLAGKPLVIDKVASACMENGVFIMTGFTNYLIVAPPLIAEETDLDRGVTTLDKSLNIADAMIASGTEFR
jgi:4-aminobutyrate aminotransferase-like enzyme